MRLLILLFFTFFIISCHSNETQLIDNCTWSAGYKITSEEDAIKVATYYLNSLKRDNEFYKDSVTVTKYFNEPSVYEVSFKRSDSFQPSFIFLVVRKSDGCVKEFSFE